MALDPVNASTVAPLPVRVMLPVVRVTDRVLVPVDEKRPAVSVLEPSTSVPCVSVNRRLDPTVMLSASVIVMPLLLTVTGKSSVWPLLVTVPVLKKVTVFAPAPTVMPAVRVSAPTEMPAFVQVPVKPVKSSATIKPVIVSVSDPANTFTVLAFNPFPPAIVRVPVEPEYVKLTIEGV